MYGKNFKKGSEIPTKTLRISILSQKVGFSKAKQWKCLVSVNLTDPKILGF